MAKLYFHLRAGDALVPDLEGAELDDSDETARHLMRLLERAGWGNHRGWSFEITDESGEYIDTIPVEGLLGAVH
ncbi:MAG: hypothetical protein K2Y29_15490 [Beijerinckiaceae bacterium]|nr:hypothetical protein [Beijerinckiaceae bacterium]